MSTTHPLVLLVHGAFAESASWNGVLSQDADPRGTAPGRNEGANFRTYSAQTAVETQSDSA